MATPKPKKPETRPDPFERARWMTVGEVGRAYSMVLTSEQLTKLGFPPNEVGASKLYSASLLGPIGKALAASVLEKAEAFSG